ncbi:hypothetical protein [Polynucleobacter sp. 80A-SIGWE]|uniref:hypothetical protein n=1 Tax=Polynucleobacter sp. 80A-SIGWE TaxID=2689100 RepID=UPI001C0B680C|nr:hypothetical protein [Polynucleobacter sp. 80A-SIGWE]MBU3588754.1 hypothetical protein [Polynucleobacter sp. 80A-SIGWE]
MKHLKIFLTIACVSFAMPSTAANIKLDMTQGNCKKVNGVTQGYEDAVINNLNTSDIQIIKAEWGTGYGLCNMKVRANGRLYDCDIPDILSSDNGKTAFAAARTTYGATRCTKR